MTDVFTRKQRSEVMSRIRAKDTKPEILVRKFLFANGFRYRLHQMDLPGKPDIVLKKYSTIILVHGCFWHGHNNCRIFRMPKSRQDYWKPKIERNISRVIRDKKQLKKMGWKVIIIWECQLKRNKLQKTLSTLVDKITTPKLRTSSFERMDYVKLPTRFFTTL